MIIVPGSTAVRASRHSRELSRRIDDAVRDYRRDNPDASEADVRAALLQSAPGSESTYVVRRKRVVAVAVAAALVGAFTAVSSSGGKFTSPTWTLIAGVVVAVGVVAFAAIRLAQRS